MNLLDAMRLVLVDGDRGAPGWNAAATRLYQELCARMRRSMPRQLDEEPEELATELFLALLRRSVDPERMARVPEAYLQRAVRNYLYDRLRRRLRALKRVAPEPRSDEEGGQVDTFERLDPGGMEPAAVARYTSLGGVDAERSERPVGFEAFVRVDEAYRASLETRRADRRVRDTELGEIHRRLLREGASFVEHYDRVAGADPKARNTEQRRVTRYRRGLAEFVEEQSALAREGGAAAVSAEDADLVLVLLDLLRGVDVR